MVERCCGLRTRLHDHGDRCKWQVCDVETHAKMVVRSPEFRVARLRQRRRGRQSYILAQDPTTRRGPASGFSLSTHNEQLEVDPLSSTSVPRGKASQRMARTLKRPLRPKGLKPSSSDILLEPASWECRNPRRREREGEEEPPYDAISIGAQCSRQYCWGGGNSRRQRNKTATRGSPRPHDAVPPLRRTDSSFPQAALGRRPPHLHLD